MENRVEADGLSDEEAEDLLRHMDANDDPEYVHYSALQLMCFESFAIFSEPCDCHGFGLLQSAVSVHNNSPSDLLSMLWPALELEELPHGSYVVTSWVGSMFYELAPVFLNRDVCGIRMLTINVTSATRFHFLRAVSRLFDLGILPCVYLRKMIVMLDDNSLVLCSEPWYAEAINLYIHWQNAEIDLMVQ